MTIRFGAGELAASLGVLCQGTGLAPKSIVRCLAIGKKLGLLEL